jgi:hypothetical protein
MSVAAVAPPPDIDPNLDRDFKRDAGWQSRKMRTVGGNRCGQLAIRIVVDP